jgi:ubiquinone/menaquinone biosynthesis C-methylase UbiE
VNDRVFHASQAARLDSPDRLVWLPPQEIVEQLGLEPGMIVVDIGAGTGYFCLPIAWQVGTEGKVYAVDLQPAMLAILANKLADANACNIELVVGHALQTKLPASICDLVFLANVWHELDDRNAVLDECRRVLKPNGRVAILDWRDDVSGPPGPPAQHRIPVRDVVEMVSGIGWRRVHQSQAGPYSYMVIASAQPACPLVSG